MLLTHKIRLYPTREQDDALVALLGACRELYNAALEERIGAWKVGQRVTWKMQSAQMPFVKEVRPELKQFDACALRYPLLRLKRSFAAFFRRCKARQTPGFPRFKGKYHFNSIDFPQSVKVVGRKLYLPKIGEIKGRGWREITGTVKHVTIKRSCGKWYATMAVESKATPLPPSTDAVGIDVGLASFATLSDGTTVENPRFYEAGERQRRVASRRVARRVRGSSRRRKAVLLLQKAHERVANQRSDFHHKLSRKLINRFGLIAVEDLNVRGLAAGILAKQVNDAGWSSFIEKLAYKAANAGRQLVKVDPNGTSQLCVCGAAVPKTLKDRWHHCQSCGLSLPRDHVSALVIVSRARHAGDGYRGPQSIVGQPSGVNVEEVVSCVA